MLASAGLALRKESIPRQGHEGSRRKASSQERMMEFVGNFRRLTPVQRNTFIACFLGWALDAFDFFILTFCVSALATQFRTNISSVAEAIFITRSEEHTS